ncbi:MAG: hypothetical protein IJ265_01380, partial [Oscillospiraceae bacterium]|nr:hypothetical protein [Oscillospiraceae bacterium]
MKKRMTAMMMTAAMVLTTLTGCGYAMEYDGATLEISMGNSWRNTEVEGVKSGYNPVHAWGNCMLLSRSDNQRTHQDRFQFINTETGESVEFKSKAAEERTTASNFVGCSTVIEYDDGTVGLVMYEHNRREGIVVRYCIEVYDEHMNYLRTEEIPEEFHRNTYLDCWVDNQGNWYVESGSTLTTYNSKYQKYGDISLPAGAYIEEMVQGSEDGTMYASVVKNDKSGGEYYEIYEINGKERTIESTGVFNHLEYVEKYVSHDHIQSYLVADFVGGGNGYDFCWNGSDGLYGYKDGEESKVISWINSDFPVGEVSEAYFMDNGSVVALTGRIASHQYYLCTPRTEEEIENTELISLSTLGLLAPMENAVIDYNKAENGYRIVVVDYNQYNTDEDDTLGKQKLQEDMLDGIVADMVCTDGMHFENLANKGIFADWYDLMDADESFNREDYLQNFFHAYEYDDKLQRLAVQYSVHAAMAKTQFAGEQEGPDLAAYSDLMSSIPAGMDFYDFYNREMFMEQYFQNYMNAFVDAKNAKCYFDTPEFARILGMIGTLPTWEELGRMDESDQANRMPSYFESHLAFQEDRAFIQDAVFCQPIHFRRENRLTFHDEPVTMVGVPMDYDEGNGGLFRADFTVSVNAQSEQQAAIWDFMKHLLEEEYQ